MPCHAHASTDVGEAMRGFLDPGGTRGNQGEPGGVQENPGGAARFRFAFIARSGYLCLLPAVGGAEEMGDDYFPQSNERHFEKFLNYPKLRL